MLLVNGRKATILLFFCFFVLIVIIMATKPPLRTFSIRRVDLWFFPSSPILCLSDNSLVFSSIGHQYKFLFRSFLVLLRRCCLSIPNQIYRLTFKLSGRSVEKGPTEHLPPPPPPSLAMPPTLWSLLDPPLKVLPSSIHLERSKAWGSHWGGRGHVYLYGT